MVNKTEAMSTTHTGAQVFGGLRTPRSGVNSVNSRQRRCQRCQQIPSPRGYVRDGRPDAACDHTLPHGVSRLLTPLTVVDGLCTLITWTLSLSKEPITRAVNRCQQCQQAVCGGAGESQKILRAKSTKPIEERRNS
jgi:hypothetical protein